jgi:ribosome biogenesis GTPase / thiamine phosphate phosphatase
MYPETEGSRLTDLTTLGWDAERDNEFTEHRASGLVPGRVAVQHRGAYDVLTEQGELRCEVPQRLVRDAAGPADLPAVGDWVAVEPTEPGQGTIHALLPRRTRFSRLAAHDPGSHTTQEQVVAANVDVVFVVTSITDDLSTRRLERYLTLGWESGARPVVLLTKADLVDDPGPAVAEVAAVALGVPIHPVSVRTGVGLDAVRAELTPGLTAALLGSSGVGKSTLVNTLLGEELLATQEVRDDGRGRHTTSRRELIRVPGGGLVIDTPGMRELQLWVSDHGLEEAFDDVTSLFAECRFADCSHTVEPGCAVQAALQDGTLAPERWESYRKLERELEALELRLDKQAQSAARRRYRTLNRAMRARRRQEGRD